jgi:hypothetical protein
MLSDTTLGSLVRTHGQIIRQAEQLEVTTLLQRDDLTTLALQVVPHDQPRRRAGWPKELNAALDRALAAEQVCPPDIAHSASQRDKSDLTGSRTSDRMVSPNTHQTEGTDEPVTWPR